MAIIQWFKQHITTLLGYEKRPKQLAIACAVGVYIAVCPLIGFHTLLKIGCAWIFGLSFPVLFIISTVINNPWTMMGVYGIDYMFGRYLLESMSINHYAYNPAIIDYFTSWITAHLGIGQFSFLAFMIGGNLLAIIAALLTYPFAYFLIFNIQTHQRALQFKGIEAARIISGGKEQPTPLFTKALTRKEYETSGPE